MTLMDRFRLWRRMRELHKLIKDHANVTSESVAILAKTNPTLASLTYNRAVALMTAKPLPTRGAEMRKRMDATCLILMDALESEDRRLDAS